MQLADDIKLRRKVDAVLHGFAIRRRLWNVISIPVCLSKSVPPLAREPRRSLSFY